MSGYTHDIAIIGAGAAGLVTAGGTAQFGAKVVLFEPGDMGGECLNTGCVPSKALLAAAHAAHVSGTSGGFGVDFAPPSVNWARVQSHVHDVIAAIAPHDSVERFEGFGVEVVREYARFTGRDTLEAGGKTYRAKRIVVATGSAPAVPPIPGLREAPYLTNETVFDLPEKPEHLIILGGGAIGCELAQAHRRLGCAVTIVEADKLLPRDDPAFVAVVRAALIADGVTVIEGVKGTAVSGNISVALEDGRTVTGSHLLVAAGRVARTQGFGLEVAGVETGRNGIKVDARLRTTNKHIFAAGDCRDGPRLTHAAGYDAGIVIRNLIFRIPAKADYSVLPWVTFTDPELAQVGPTEAEARSKWGDKLTVLSFGFDHNDRAMAERRTAGGLKVMAVGGRPIGATVCGPAAGEIIQYWELAIRNRLKLSSLSGGMAPYPTFGEISKATAGSAFTATLFSPRVRSIVRLLLRLP